MVTEQDWLGKKLMDVMHDPEKPHGIGARIVAWGSAFRATEYAIGRKLDPERRHE